MLLSSPISQSCLDLMEHALTGYMVEVFHCKLARSPLVDATERYLIPKIIPVRFVQTFHTLQLTLNID
jgi:hypothetical protein